MPKAETKMSEMDYHKSWVGNVLIHTYDGTGKETWFVAKDYSPNERHPHHTGRFWDGKRWYLACNCEIAPKMTKAGYSDFADEFEWMKNLRP